MKDAESKTILPGLSQLKEFAENIGNYVLIAENYGLRGGLGFEADGDSRFFTGPNFALTETSDRTFRLDIFQMWTLEARTHKMIGADEVKRLLEEARDWFDEHVPPDKR